MRLALIAPYAPRASQGGPTSPLQADASKTKILPDMGRALKFAFFFGLTLYVARELLHWALTGELAAIVRGGGESRTLTWTDEPGYLLFTAIVRIGEFLVGVGGMIVALRSDGLPPQAR